MLFLRTVNKDGKSYNDFQWPLEVGAMVEAPDWDASPECGHGLHGLRNGMGDWGLMNWDVDAKALIVEAETHVDIDGDKCKFPSAKVVEIGVLPALLTKVFVPALFQECFIDASQLAASGDASQLAASGGLSQLAASGRLSQLAASGDESKLAASGDESKLAASGDESVIAAAGINCKVQVGKNGAVAVAYRDANERVRFAVGYEGENIKAGVWYVVNEAGEFVEQKKS